MAEKLCSFHLSYHDISAEAAMYIRIRFNHSYTERIHITYVAPVICTVIYTYVIHSQNRSYTPLYYPLFTVNYTVHMKLTTPLLYKSRFISEAHLTRLIVSQIINFALKSTDVLSIRSLPRHMINSVINKINHR